MGSSTRKPRQQTSEARAGKGKHMIVLCCIYHQSSRLEMRLCKRVNDLCQKFPQRPATCGRSFSAPHLQIIQHLGTPLTALTKSPLCFSSFFHPGRNIRKPSQLQTARTHTQCLRYPRSLPPLPCSLALFLPLPLTSSLELLSVHPTSRANPFRL